jgi:DNA-binding Lrp family transcriptional regulator
MKKSKSANPATPPITTTSPSPALTRTSSVRYVDGQPVISSLPCTIHTPVNGGIVMADRAYVLINVQPGQTSAVARALTDIKQIKTIDPCWGKPDIIVLVEVPDQDALSQLVLSRIHAIPGVTQTDTHLVYRLKETAGK